jgi:hypothetical protein
MDKLVSRFAFNFKLRLCVKSQPFPEELSLHYLGSELMDRWQGLGPFLVPQTTQVTSTEHRKRA